MSPRTPHSHNPPNSDDEDKSLIDRINRDWPEGADAFRTLYDRHKAAALRIALRFATDRDAAMDAVQEAFLALWGRFPGFVLRGKLLTFLYPVVRNHALSGVRRRKWLRFSDSAGDRAGGDGVEVAEDGESAGLRAAIDALASGQREVLLLRVVEGLSVQEVGEALGIPAGTVKSRLFKALGTLREDPRARRHFDEMGG